MASEWDGLLEGVVRAILAQYLYAEPGWAICDPDDLKELPAMIAVLRDKLLPLLEAGQTMRMNIGAYAVALNANPFKREDTSRAIIGCVDGLQAWDAAREAALKGSINASS